MLVDTKCQSWKGTQLRPKLDQVIYTSVPNCLQNCIPVSLTQVSHYIFCLQDFHWPKFEKGHYSTKKTLTEKKKKKTHWQQAITQEVSDSIYSNVNQIIYFSLTIYSLGFKALASIVFEILCWQDFIHILFKGHNSGKAHNLDKIKSMCQLFFSWGIHIWNFKTLACTVQKLGCSSKCAM